MTFIEEPLGVPADQGYGFPQVDFGQCIGPNGEFEIIRKLGWRPNVNHLPSSKASILLIVPAAFSQKCSIRRSQDTDRTGDEALGSELLGRDAGPDVYNAGYGMAGPTAALHAFVTFAIAFRSPRQGTEGLPSSLLGHGRLDRLILRDTLRGLSQMHASRVLHTELDRPSSEQHYVQCSEPDNRGQFALEYRIDPGSSPPLNKPILPTIEQALSGSFMIGDFGSGYKTVKFDEVRRMPESSLVLAPEVIMQRPWNCKIDIWAFGCLVYELLLGVPLFSRRQDMAPADTDRDQLAQLRALTGDAFPADFEILPDILDAHPPAHFTLLLREKARALKIPEHDIAGATDLISQCLRIDLAASPTALELLNQSRWLAELGGDP
ncbi:kinase-like domain-containing protein [Mycena metata]|uniref:Kinase-like domain-containing protein n=1 Tax=Mycena metata TaxID=1033252 RepID=A0AAD7HAQ6_9AGAR|nr:kinase-like domain-containing protein [Mycena metata]